MVNIVNAIKTFGTTDVLQELNLQIMETQIVGLAGASGSGKSTLLRCIQGLEWLDSGTIERPQNTGFMFQDFQLFPHMTVWENLLYSPLQKYGPQCIKDAQRLLESLEIIPQKDMYPHCLSGGQKQRTALARALMMHPDLLLCDEPTSGLDRGSIQNVTQILDSVHRKGVALLIASHDLDFLCSLCHRIVMIRQGKVVLDVPAQDIRYNRETFDQFYKN